MKNIKIKNFFIGEKAPLVFIVGPCVIESEESCFQSAQRLKEIFHSLNTPFIFKSSYDKANRTSIHSYRGPGIKKGLEILSRIKKELELPIVTDIHTTDEARLAGSICDMIQIPAFLCRQTDLILAAASTPAAINIKKGQFISPWDMLAVVEKARSNGKDQILLTDRGVSFGYNNLVSDMRSLSILKEHGHPVCFDATHSVQLPGSAGSSSGGQKQFIKPLAQAAVAAGANCIFIEAHPQPEEAKSDASSMLPFCDLPDLVKRLNKIYRALQ